MSGITTWKARPVFITSTFKDMQEERDFLRNVVFPDLEERLRARRQHLEWIDLRVGVSNAGAASEEARELQVLKVCLAEVKRSRPFLIALIGDRYGWVPPEARIAAVAAEEGFEADVVGRSVTDLEIDFGVLSDPAQITRSYFYFRQPLPYSAMGDLAPDYSEEYDINDPAAKGRAEKLNALKQRIKERFPERVRSYFARWEGNRVIGFDELQNKLTSDLWRELDAAAAKEGDGEITWQRAESAAMEDFTEDRARDFVGRADVLREVASLAASSPGETKWGLCITGDSGAGKSALWGTLRARLAELNGALVLAHAAGASQRSSSIESMLRRFIDELATHLGEPAILADDASDEDIDAAFTSLLWRTAEKHRVLLLVDALDQLEKTPRALHMSWLPKLWPNNARLIATAINGQASKALLQRTGVTEVGLMPLDAFDARGIVVAICKRYHRSFDPEVIDTLVTKKGLDNFASGNPLWLTMAVEELNLLDADDFVHVERDLKYRDMPAAIALRTFMCDMVNDEMPADVPSLYAWSFDRATELFGAGLTQAFLGSIAASRGGWRESDFRHLLPQLSGEPWDELRFAQLRRSFRGQMRQRGALGQWDFAHNQMRSAAKAWLQHKSGKPEKTVHASIIDHLLALEPEDVLRPSEAMFHLLAAGDFQRAARYYGDSLLTEAEVEGATRVLADAVTAPENTTSEEAAQRICRLLDTPDISTCAKIGERFLFKLAPMLEQFCSLDAQLVVYTSTEELFDHLVALEPDDPRWPIGLSVSHQGLGSVRLAQGDLDRALASYRKMYAVCEGQVKSTPDDASWRALSKACIIIGDVLTAQGKLLEAKKAFLHSAAIADRQARADPDDSEWQSDLVVSHDRIGDVLKAQGDINGALASYRQAVAIADRLAKSDSGNSSRQSALSVMYTKAGHMLTEFGNLSDALKFIRQGLAIADRLAHADPSNLMLQHNLEAAYERAGDVQQKQGNISEAFESFYQSLAIIERLARADPGNATRQHRLAISHIHLGDVLMAQGNLSEGTRSFRQSHDIFSLLAAADPSNTVWQRSLAVSHARLGSLLRAQGNLSEALESFRASLIIGEHLAQADPSNAAWQYDVSVAHNDISSVFWRRGASRRR